MLALASAYLPSNGINEKGLSVSIDYKDSIEKEISYSNTKEADINELTLLRIMLDSCATVDDAYKIIFGNYYDIFLAFDKHFTITVVDESDMMIIDSCEDFYNNRNLLKLNITEKDDIQIESNTTSDVHSTLNSNTTQLTYSVFFNTKEKSIDYYLYADTKITSSFKL